MIYIKFGPGAKIIFQGHAEYAENGKDIVCAGVSTLYMTFLASTNAKETVMGNVRMLEADPVYKNRRIHEAVCTGLVILSKNYPKNVKILGESPYPAKVEKNIV